MPLQEIKLPSVVNVQLDDGTILVRHCEMGYSYTTGFVDLDEFLGLDKYTVRNRITLSTFKYTKNTVMCNYIVSADHIKFENNQIEIDENALKTIIEYEKGFEHLPLGNYDYEDEILRVMFGGFTNKYYVEIFIYIKTINVFAVLNYDSDKLKIYNNTYDDYIKQWREQFIGMIFVRAVNIADTTIFMDNLTRMIGRSDRQSSYSILMKGDVKEKVQNHMMDKRILELLEGSSLVNNCRLAVNTKRAISE